MKPKTKVKYIEFEYEHDGELHRIKQKQILIARVKGESAERLEKTKDTGFSRHYDPETKTMSFYKDKTVSDIVLGAV